MKLYTLIHVCQHEQSIHNSWAANFEDQIRLYLNCAVKLQKSLECEGIKLAVLTNDQAFLQGLDVEHPLEITQLNFRLEVPAKMKFFSAHFKIEVYKYLATLNEHYVGLVDSDLLCINSIPQAFKNCISERLPTFYNITSQVIPAFGEKRVIFDKELVGGYKSFGLWAGGEFLTGPPEFFAKLYREVLELLDVYFKNCNILHHQGDEMLLSVAIEKMLRRGEMILDAGSLGFIHRYWNARTLHKQIPRDSLSDFFLLHLPGDKNFIATVNSMSVSNKHGLQEYLKYVKISKIKNFFWGVIKPPFLRKVYKKMIAN